MIFTNTGQQGCGSSHAPAIMNKLKYAGSSNLHYAKWMQSYIRDAFEYEQNQNPKLEITWNYQVLFNGNEIYSFHSYQYFHISEADKEATLSSLEELVNSSHKYLQETFSDRIDEFPIFNQVSDLSPEETNKVVHLLTGVLQKIQE